MSDVTVSLSFSATKNGLTVAASKQLGLTMAGTNIVGDVQIIGTVAETITLIDVTTIGYTFLRNTDPTNFIQVDSANTFDKFPQKLLPGEFILLKPETATIYAKADTAPCELQVIAVEL